MNKFPKKLLLPVIALASLTACDPPEENQNRSPVTESIPQRRNHTNREISRLVDEALAGRGKTEEEIEREEELERIENIHDKFNDFIEKALDLFEETDYPHNANTPGILDKVLDFYNEHFDGENPAEIIVFAGKGDLPEGVCAAYVPNTKTVELSPDFDPNNKFDMSALLHEVIHAWQYNKFFEKYGEEGLARVLRWENVRGLTSLEHEVSAIVTQIEVLNLHSKDYMRSASMDRVAAFQNEGISGLEKLEPLQVKRLAKKLKVTDKDQSAAMKLFLKYAMNYYADPTGPKASLEKVPRSFINNVAMIYQSMQGRLYEYIPKTDSQVADAKKGDQITIGDGIHPLQLKDGFLAIYDKKGAKITNTDELLS